MGSSRKIRRYLAAGLSPELFLKSGSKAFFYLRASVGEVDVAEAFLGGRVGAGRYAARLGAMIQVRVSS